VRQLNRLAAVHDHGVADDEGGCIRTQPQDGIGDFFGLAHPSDWFLRDHLRAPFGRAPGEATHHRGVDAAGTDGVDADVLRGVVEGRRAGEAYHAVFRGGVRRAALDADDPCPRGGVHDRATSLLEHQRDLVLHAQEDAPEVDVDDPVPFLLVVVRGWSRLPRLDARVIEGEVQPSESLARLLERGLHVVGLCDVAPDRQCAAAFLLDQARRFLIACSATSPTTTLAPARAKAKAVARPIPLLPPVINATLPVKLPFSFVVAISDFAQLASHAHVHDKTIPGLFRNDLQPSVVDSIHRYLCDLRFDLLESAKLQHVLSLADASCIGSSEGGSI